MEGFQSSIMASVKDTPFLQAAEELASWKLTEFDRAVLQQTDEEYQLISWEKLKDTIGTISFRFVMNLF